MSRASTPRHSLAGNISNNNHNFNPSSTNSCLSKDQLHHQYKSWKRQEEPLYERHSPRFFLSQRSARENPIPALYRGNMLVASALSNNNNTPNERATSSHSTSRNQQQQVTCSSSLSATTALSIKPHFPAPPERASESFAKDLSPPHVRTSDKKQEQQQDNNININTNTTTTSTTTTLPYPRRNTLPQNQKVALDQDQQQVQQQFQQLLKQTPHQQQTTTSFLPPVVSSSSSAAQSNKFNSNKNKNKNKNKMFMRPAFTIKGDCNEDDFPSTSAFNSSPTTLKQSSFFARREPSNSSTLIGNTNDNSGLTSPFASSDLTSQQQQGENYKHQRISSIIDQAESDDDYTYNSITGNSSPLVSNSFTNNNTQGSIRDDASAVSAGSAGRRAFELLRRLFILQVSERSVTRSFLDKLPSSEVIERIEQVLKKVGASRYMSLDDFHLVLNQALCPDTAKAVERYNLAKQSMNSKKANTANSQNLPQNSFLRKPVGGNVMTAGSRARELEQQQIQDRTDHFESLTSGNNKKQLKQKQREKGEGEEEEEKEQPPHITMTESRVLFSLFENNGLVGLQQIAEGFDLLLRGEQFQLLTYTRRIVCEPDNTEKESTVTVLELEWMLNAVGHYFSDDNEIKRRSLALISALWKESHVGCVTRRTFRKMVEEDTFLLRAIQILPRFGSDEDFALRPEERPALEPNPLEMIDSFVANNNNNNNNANNTTDKNLNASVNFLNPNNNSNQTQNDRKLSISIPQDQPQQQQGSNNNQVSSSIAGLLSQGKNRRQSVVGRGLAFETLDLYDPLFKGDQFVNVDRAKQATASEVGEPKFFSLRGQPYCSVFGSAPQPIFDVR